MIYNQNQPYLIVILSKIVGQFCIVIDYKHESLVKESFNYFHHRFDIEKLKASFDSCDFENVEETLLCIWYLYQLEWNQWDKVP